MKVFTEFEIGNTTCAIEPGKFCRFLRVSHYGSRYSCTLFLGLDGAPYLIFENDSGWLTRCQRCLEAFPPEEQDVNSND